MSPNSYHDYARITGDANDPQFPDSAIHRWKLDDVETGTATDSIGSSDGNVAGITSKSGSYVGGAGSLGDSSGEHIDVGTLGDFGQKLDTDFAIAATIKSSNRGDFIGNNNTTRNFRVTSSGASSGVTGQGSFSGGFRDDNGNDLTVATGTGLIDDGNKHRCVWNKKTNDPSNWEAWVDNVNQTAQTYADTTSPTVSNFDIPLYLVARNDGGTATTYNGVVDNVIIYNSSLSSDEVQRDYDLQPWT